MKKIKQKLWLIPVVSLCVMMSLSLKSNAATGTITTDTIRLRKEASTKSSILELISKEEKVEVISEENDWYKVTYKGMTGYLSKDYVKVDGELTNTAEEKNTEESENNSNQNEQEPEENDVNTENTENSQENNSEENNAEGNNETENVSKVVPKIYLLPLINSTVIYEVKVEDAINTLQTINGWNYVEVNNTKGWVREQDIQNRVTQSDNTNNPESENKENNEKPENTSKEAYIASAQVNFRKETSTDSEVIDTLSQNTKVEVIETDGEWSKVKYKNQEGYIATRLLSDKKIEISNRSSTSRMATAKKENNTTTMQTNNEQPKTSNNTATSDSSKKSELVAYAKQFLGCKYVYGGTSPSGFDCSGFTQYVYKHFGYSLSRSSSAQSSNGTYVEKSNLQMGDLLFFTNHSTGKGIGHVGIYIGNNQFIHASSEKTGVKISELNSSYYQKRYVTARRIF